KRFYKRYGGSKRKTQKSWMGMYDEHASEGVVGLIGDVPRDAIIGLRAFRGVPEEDVLETIIDELVMSESEGDDDLTPECSGGFNFGSGSGFPPPGDGSGGPGITA